MQADGYLELFARSSKLFYRPAKHFAINKPQSCDPLPRHIAPMLIQFHKRDGAVWPRSCEQESEVARACAELHSIVPGPKQFERMCSCAKDLSPLSARPAFVEIAGRGVEVAAKLQHGPRRRELLGHTEVRRARTHEVNVELTLVRSPPQDDHLRGSRENPPRVEISRNGGTERRSAARGADGTVRGRPSVSEVRAISCWLRIYSRLAPTAVVGGVIMDDEAVSEQIHSRGVSAGRRRQGRTY